MSEGRSCSFWDLYAATIIKIPQIQRDYVQGRKSTRVKVNRETFVKELVQSAIKCNKKDLNFIYGYYEDGCFIPIDGQQRLTTLFMLYAYVFFKAGHINELRQNNSLNFSYETRYTTNRFLDDMFDWMKKNEGKSLNDSSIKLALLDSTVYSYSWNIDPSIISFLTILETIERKFSDLLDDSVSWEDLFTILKSPSCPITFMLLEIDKHKLGKPNQLYIRMNSRGKQLTDYENFKAALYENILKSDDQPSLKKWKDEHAKKMDGEWYECIWDFASCDNAAEKYADTYYRNLIHWVFYNRLIVSKENMEIKKKLDNTSIENLYLDDYLSSDFESCLKDFSCVLNTLCNIRKNDALKEFKEQSKLSYDENKNGFDCNLENNQQKVYLCALAKYGADHQDFDIDDFKKWFRVIVNLSKNTEFDESSYINACKSIFELSDIDFVKSPNIIKSLNGFARSQINEEFFKQKIINTNPSWQEAILHAEVDDYFDGEILFSFLLFDRNDYEPSIDPEEYKKAWDKISAIFMWAKGENDTLFHRALLTIDDYSKWTSKTNIKTFYQYNETHHDNDWRGMLRPDWEKDSPKPKDGFRYFKQFYEKYASSHDKLDSFAEKCIKEAVDSSEAPSKSVRLLIKDKSLFEYCGRGAYYVLCANGNEYLMRTKRRDEYAEVNAYYINQYYTDKRLEPEMVYGGSSKSDKSFVKIKGYHVEYNGQYFINDSGVAYQLESGNIETADDMISFLNGKLGLMP